MLNVKLQFEINLKNNLIIGEERTSETYNLIIRFLDKDETFECNFTNKKFVIHGCKNGFRIRSVWDEPYGRITDDGLMIPRLDKIGFELKKTFPTEHDRYVFVKKLYYALEDWANHWEGFNYDGESEIEMEDNLWTIQCKQRVRRGTGMSHAHRSLIEKNIFF
jgi:hypothetical protein